MQFEDDRDQGQPAVPDCRATMEERGRDADDIGVQLALLAARLTGIETELAALKTGMSIIESRLTGIENRQRHAESRRERIEARVADFSFGVDRVHCDMATLKDRVRCVELDVREMSGDLLRGVRRNGTLGPVGHAVSRAVGLNSG